MTKGNNGSLADFIIDQMANEGFEVSEFKGMPGHEVVTFKNKQGETRTVKFGFGPVKPNKNIRVYFDKEGNIRPK